MSFVASKSDTSARASIRLRPTGGLQSLGIDYPILSDPDRAVARAYGVLRAHGFPRAAFYIGKDGRILDVDCHVRPSSHGADVGRRLEAQGFRLHDRKPRFICTAMRVLKTLTTALLAGVPARAGERRTTVAIEETDSSSTAAPPTRAA